MNRTLQLTVVATSACLVVLLLFGASKGTSASADGPYTQLGVYSEVLSRIKADYVEEPDMKGVTNGAINGMLESLDPFASYLSADQYKQYLREKDNGKAGLGLVLARRANSINIVDSIPGSPADQASLSTGDFIESISNVATRDMPLAFAELLLQGEPGTSVEMSVLRLGTNDPQKVVLIRQAITYPEVTSKMDGQVGVVTLLRVDAAHVRDASTKFAELEKQGAKKLILDLRRASTGNPEDGVALANLFLDKGLITYTLGQKSPKQEFTAVASRAITKLPLVVLTNRGTAGPAEVAAAALLESKRATLVGERTYGNAAVRKAVTLEDGSAVILATAKYYSPGGKAIQDTGVTPTVVQFQVAEAAEDDEADADPAAKRAVDPAQKVEDMIYKKGLETIVK